MLIPFLYKKEEMETFLLRNTNVNLHPFRLYLICALKWGTRLEYYISRSAFYALTMCRKQTIIPVLYNLY